MEYLFRRVCMRVAYRLGRIHFVYLFATHMSPLRGSCRAFNLGFLIHPTFSVPQSLIFMSFCHLSFTIRTLLWWGFHLNNCFVFNGHMDPIDVGVQCLKLFIAVCVSAIMEIHLYKLFCFLMVRWSLQLSVFHMQNYSCPSGQAGLPKFTINSIHLLIPFHPTTLLYR